MIAVLFFYGVKCCHYRRLPYADSTTLYRLKSICIENLTRYLFWQTF